MNYPLPFWFVVQRSTFWIACGKTLSKLKTVGKSSMMRQVMEALLNRKASISSIVDLPEMSCWIHSEYPSPLNLYTSLTAAGTHALFCIWSSNHWTLGTQTNLAITGCFFFSTTTGLDDGHGRPKSRKMKTYPLFSLLTNLGVSRNGGTHRWFIRENPWRSH